MRHEVEIRGEAFALRPVASADAEVIVALRTDPRLGAFLGDTSPDLAAQHAWLERYFAREGDYYFAIVRASDGGVEGTVAVYDVDRAAQRAEWGRWVLRAGSLASIESALLVYRAAFRLLGLESLYCRTVAENVQVVSFHDSAGLRRTGRLENQFTIKGEPHDAVQHELERPEFDAVVEPRLERLAAMVARRLR